MKIRFFLLRTLFFQCISYDTDLKNRFLRRKKIFSYANFLFINKSINGDWHRLNPFNNDENWTLNIPADTHDPQINDVILQPINEPIGISSGYSILNTNGSITNYNSNTVKVHFQNAPNGTTEPIFNQNIDQLAIYGSIGPIIQARDRSINSIAAGGNGLTIYKASYSIGAQEKYLLEFKAIESSLPGAGINDDYHDWNSLFHVPFNIPTTHGHNDPGCTTCSNRYFGNNDFIELRHLENQTNINENDHYLAFHQLVNNTQSNGIWFTKARQGTPEVFQHTPIQIARSNNEALYPDGRLDLSFMVEDESSRTDNVDLPILLDNFLPHIEHLQVLIGGYPLVTENWIFNAQTGMIELVQLPPQTGIPIGDQTNVQIVFRASEPLLHNPILNTLTVRLIRDDGVMTMGTIQQVSPDEKTFTVGFTVSESTSQTFTYTVDICGQDLAGNQLLAIQDYNALALQVPSRDAMGNWTGTVHQGCDQSHSFSINSCIISSNFQGQERTATRSRDDNTCFLANFTHQATPTDGCSFRFIDQSIGDNITAREWQLGDGAISNHPTPEHTYDQAGCYPVTLTVWNGGQSNSYTQEICFTTCESEESPASSNVTCSINGPTRAMAGQTIQLTTLTFNGVPSYGYNWSVPIDASPGVVFGNSQDFVLDEFSASNGEIQRFIVNVTDLNGDDATCTHEVTIAGNVPDVSLTAYGDLLPNTYFYAVAFVNQFNLTGTATYKFDFYTAVGTLIHSSGDLVEDYDYDNGGQPIFTACGIFKVCATVTDEAGTYQVCEDIIIGDQDCITPPPPTPPTYELVALNNEGAWTATALEVPTCDCRQLGVRAGNAAFFNYDSYEIDLLSDTGGATQTIGSTQVVPNAATPNTVYPLGVFCPQQYNLKASGICVNFTMNVCPFGACNGNVGLFCDLGCESITVNETCHLTTSYSEVAINEIVYHSDCSTPYLEVMVECGAQESSTIPTGQVCSGSNQYYKKYAWKAYSLDAPYEEIEGLLQAGNSTNYKCVGIDKTHSFFQQFGQGDLVQFRVLVEVTDYEDFVVSQSQLVTMPLPLRIELPTPIRRCPNVSAAISDQVIAVGGTSPYTYYWVVENNIITDQTAANPLLQPFPNNIITPGIILGIEDAAGCTATYQTELVITDLDFTMKNASVRACRTGESGQLIGPIDPINMGGSGKYAFLWTSNNATVGVSLLSDPTIANPIVSYHTSVIQYSLTVTDLLGGCSLTKNVSISGADNAELTASTGHGATLDVCYGEKITLGSTINIANGSNNTTILWETNNPYYQGTTNTPTISIDENVHRHPGTYTYKVTVIDDFSGCVARDEVQLTVNKAWKYTGFESDYEAITSTDNTLQAAFTAISPAVNKVLLNSEDANSGAIGPLSYTWSPNEPAAFSTTNGVVTAAFNPQLETNYSLIVTDDATACSQMFSSNEYRVFQEEAAIQLWQVSPPNGATCAEYPACFNISVNTFAATNAALPSYLTVRIAIKTSSGGDYGVFTRELAASNEDGIYKGVVCLQADQFIIPESRRIIEISIPTQNFTANQNDSYVPNYINDWYFFANDVKEAIDFYYSTKDKEVPSFICFGENVTTSAASITVEGITVVSPFQTPLACSPNVDGTLITASAQPVNFIGGITKNNSSTGLVHLRHGFHAAAGSRFHAYIDPCFYNDFNPERDTVIQSLLGQATTSEATATDYQPLLKNINVHPFKHSLHIYPNPFEATFQIAYSIKGATASEVSINLLSVTGQHFLPLLAKTTHHPGNYVFNYDGMPLPAGIYFCELVVGREKQLRKIVKVGQ